MEEFLSDIEMYFSNEIKGDDLYISGEEKNHILKVMRHYEGENLYVTDGKGKIYNSVIKEVKKDFIAARITNTFTYSNKYENYNFCIPKLRSPERFEFALEKCTEMGITKFIIYDAIRGVSKGIRLERWEKIVTAAMKQSLRSFKPEFIIIDKLKEINKFEGIKIILEQNSSNHIAGNKFLTDRSYYFIFGPEGGLDKKEVESIDEPEIYKISPNRLRTETAILKTASLITI